MQDTARGQKHYLPKTLLKNRFEKSNIIPFIFNHLTILLLQEIDEFP